MFETMFVVVMGLIVAVGVGAEIVYNVPDRRKGLLLAILAGIIIGVLCRGIIEMSEEANVAGNEVNKTYGEGGEENDQREYY